MFASGWTDRQPQDLACVVLIWRRVQILPMPLSLQIQQELQFCPLCKWMIQLFRKIRLFYIFLSVLPFYLFYHYCYFIFVRASVSSLWENVVLGNILQFCFILIWLLGLWQNQILISCIYALVNDALKESVTKFSLYFVAQDCPVFSDCETFCVVPQDAFQMRDEFWHSD